MSKYRRYKCRRGKKPELDTWIQPRCKCGRFLPKFSGSGKICDRCAKENEKERHSEYIKVWQKDNVDNREYKRIWKFVHNHIDELEVGDYI
jgi:predicted amidophosphoribosyltransferase